MSQQPVQAQENSEKTVNYKETLNLPVTDFKMKAGAATREPEIEQFWEVEQVYQKAQQARKLAGAHKFVLHDGPPYLSSDKIHIGTAMNKILKDIVTRYQYQKGHFAPYIPGYDSHGLPIENAVVKNLKGGRHSVTPAALRKLCREFALKNLDGQEANFKRLGVWGDWKNYYITMDAKFEAEQIKYFGQMHTDGYVYKGLKPVYWCPTCETALADAEVEYDDHTSHSIYVKFPIKQFKAGAFGYSQEDAHEDEKLKEQAVEGSAFVIWTTTPWTLPANLALSVNPDFMYVVIEAQEYGKLIVAEKLLETFAQHAGIKNHKVLVKVKGHSLELANASHPFIDRTVPVLSGLHVTLEAGTGVVHTAPGHGMEDYVVCQKYKKDHPEWRLDPLSPLDNRGVFEFANPQDEVPELVGEHYSKANEKVLEILKSKNALLGHSELSHSYPHCWRCHKPVIYRATPQWFVNVDKFRAKAVEEIKKVTWIPARGESRITAMVEGRTDWCVSRQRVWGVPIPAFYCVKCGDDGMLMSKESTNAVYEEFKQHSSDIWWEQEAEYFLKNKFKCEKCSGTEFKKESDIMDVWFDSGMTHTTVCSARKPEFTSLAEEQALPVELYLEGSDQHRGWFQSALLTSVMINGKAPYKTVLTHGFALDESGRKMSKSLGNVVDPNTVMKEYGADILRLWVTSVDFTNDVRIGKNKLAELAEIYKKVRNTLRFVLGNLNGFDPKTDCVPYEKLSLLDQYTLYRLHHILNNITQQFDKYDYHQYNHEIQWLCLQDLSALYFDVTKDILYCDPENAERRRAVQTVLYEVLKTLVPMLVPIMPHLAEDIWQSLPDSQKPCFDFDAPPISVTLAPWPVVNQQYLNESLREAMKETLLLRESVNMALEKARSAEKIGSALEAAVSLQAGSAKLDPDLLATMFLVSQVTMGSNAVAGEVLAEGKAENGVAITVLKAEGEKCARCWKFQLSVGQSQQHPALCARCEAAV